MYIYIYAHELGPLYLGGGELGQAFLVQVCLEIHA
jgi:hypothetical protein